MLPQQPALRIGLIGAGSMGSLHARVIAQSGDASLAWVMDPDLERAAATATRYGSTARPRVDDWRDVDAVVVAAPTDTHAHWAVQALEAGRPTLVEKPMTTDLGSTIDLVERSRALDVPLSAGFVERFNPAVRTALDIVIEPVYISSIRHSPYAPRVRSGVASDLLIHDADLAIAIAGREPAGVTATFSYCHPDSEAGAEDIADVHLTFEGGTLASLSASRVSQRKIRQLTVASLTVSAEIDLIRQDVTVYRHVGNMLLEDQGVGYRQETIIDIPVIQYRAEPLAAQLEHFIALCRGDIDAESERSGLLPAHRVLDAAIRSARLRGETIYGNGSAETR